MTACGPRHVGYGVMLWENASSSFKTGDRFGVLSKSTTQHAYLIIDKKGKEKKEVPWGFIAFFENESEAKTFAQQYKDHLNEYAFAKRRSLPIRESSAQGSTIIYKLDENEVVKIISQETEKEKAGVYENYWYKVLTKDGHLGYCFGEFLFTFSTEGDPFEKAKEYQANDPVLKSIMENVWRPEYFDEMIRTGRFDSGTFSNEIGLFSFPEKKEIRIKTPERDLTFNYTNIVKAGNTYLFEGTDLRFEMGPWQILAVSYKVNDRSMTQNFVLIKDDVEEIIAREAQNKDKKFSNFANTALSSSFYGTITFGEDFLFSWTGFTKLVPNIIPKGALENGRVSFPYYLGGSLASQYTGVISFSFNGTPPQNRINFLYQVDNEGVKLVHIPKENIEGIVINKSGVSPLTLYFKAAKRF